MNFRLFSFVLWIAVVCGGQAAAIPLDCLHRNETAPASTLRVTNNHAFPIRETVLFQLPADLAAGAGNLLAVSHSVSGGTVEAHYLPIQVKPAPEGEPVSAWIDVQLRPNESRVYMFQDVGGGAGRKSEVAVAKTFPSGLPHKVELPSAAEVDFFDLSLVEVLKDLDTFPGDRLARIEDGLAQALQPEFTLQSESHGPVKSTLHYRAAARGGNDYEIDVRYDIFSSGIADIEVVLRTSDLRSERGYLAVAKTIPSPAGEQAFIRWKGETAPVGRDESSPARWLALADADEEKNRAILAEFSPNLTRVLGDRDRAANGFLVNELVGGGENGWTMLAEIAREDVLAGPAPTAFALPEPSEPIRLNYRVLPSKTRTLEQVDQAFISFAGYQRRQIEKEEFQVTFGVDGVAFGASYSPHLIFGENWQSFTAEIRQDLRIANAIGLDWIRIQNFNAPDPRKDHLATKEGEWMLDSLAFMAEAARDTGLRLVLDFSLSPADARLVAERFGDVISFYRIQDDASEAGLPIDRVDSWRQTRDGIESAQPEARVSLAAGPLPYSLYDRLSQLGLELDAISQQVDAGDGQSSDIKDFALSLGGYATSHGKMPLHSGYTWSALAGETERAQADRFFEVSEKLLSQRSSPLVLQPPFVETAEGAQGSQPLRLDRTPKFQAHALHELVRRYGNAGNRVKTLDIQIPLVSIRPGEKRTVTVKFNNTSSRPLEIRTNLLLPPDLTADDDEKIVTLRPRQSRTIQRVIHAAADLAPGFYHFFEEARYEDTIRLAWSYASHRAAPRLDLETEPVEGVRYAGGLEQFEQINLSNLRHLVFGSEASAREVDSALHLYATLRSATGADIQRWAHDRIGDEQKKRSLALVGNQETNPLIAEIADRLPVNPLDLPAGEGIVMTVDHPTEERRFLLIVSGRDAEGIEKAASDFFSRYWTYAKDAATLRHDVPAVAAGSE